MSPTGVEQSVAVCARLARMGDVINLNRFRKQKAKKERARQAEKNRPKNGRAKPERELDARKKELELRRIDGHKLDRSQAPDPEAGA